MPTTSPTIRASFEFRTLRHSLSIRLRLVGSLFFRGFQDLPAYGLGVAVSGHHVAQDGCHLVTGTQWQLRVRDTAVVPMARLRLASSPLI